MVYIDDFNAPYGRMQMCHMVADSTEELLAMVDRIGVARRYIQYPGTGDEHFDICLSKKAKAIAAGAIEVGARDLAAMVAARRNTAPSDMSLSAPQSKIDIQPKLF